MSKVILSGHLSVPAADLTAVRAALPEHITATEAEPGCLVFSVKEDAEEGGRFSVYEEFRDERAFELHQERVRTSAWWEASQGSERHYEVRVVEG